jgi:hypothetical protein
MAGDFYLAMKPDWTIYYYYDVKTDNDEIGDYHEKDYDTY